MQERIKRSIEELKQIARLNLERRLTPDVQDRDGPWLGAVRRKARNGYRKSYGELIAKAVKVGQPKSFEKLWAVRDVNGRAECVDGEWFRSVMIKQFGFPVTYQLADNWKDSWVHPVWQNEPWFRDTMQSLFHQVHQSEDDPTQIAYNRNIDNIERNIQTRTRPGKYLTQFFSDVLSPSEIKEWAEKQVAAATCTATLKFVENNDEAGWERVYEEGPHSCMAGKECVKVYCYPDNGLRLAYLETDEGKIVARAIVRDQDGEESGYVRIYATEQRWATDLRVKLDAAGYTTDINLNGVKIQRINHRYDDSVMCPYIDTGNCGDQTIEIHDDYLIIGGDGPDACSTGGWVSIDEGDECSDCGERFDSDELTTIDDSDCRVCEHCLNNNYTYAYGRRYQDYFPQDDCIYCESDGEMYVAEYASYHDVYQCRVSDDWYHIDDLVTCDAGEYEGSLIHCDEAVLLDNDEGYAYQGDCQQVNGEWVLTENVGQCHITGEDLDIRNAVQIQVGMVNIRSNYAYTSTPAMYKPKHIWVSEAYWNVELIRENFILCGSLLLPRGYYGNEINNVAEPTNVTYGDNYTGDKFEDLFVEEAEHLLAA